MSSSDSSHELRNEVVEELILDRVSESGAELDTLLVSRGNPKGVRSVAAIVLCLMPFGIVREWRDRAFADLHFQEYAKRFEASPPGTVFTIPYNPPDGRWSMRLVKH